MSPARRAAVVLSSLLVVHAAIGLVVARDLDFTQARGALVGSAAFEIFAASFNPLGAIVALGFALIALAGALASRPGLLLVSAGGHALMAVQVLLQFGREVNWLGSRGSNLSLAILGVAGFIALAAALRDDRSVPAGDLEASSS